MFHDQNAVDNYFIAISRKLADMYFKSYIQFMILLVAAFNDFCIWLITVWQKLEEENREFFEAYHVRLILKNQILVFNRLLEKQVELMQKACPTGISTISIPNGSNAPACMSISNFAANTLLFLSHMRMAWSLLS